MKTAKIITVSLAAFLLLATAACILDNGDDEGAAQETAQTTPLDTHLELSGPPVVTIEAGAKRVTVSGMVSNTGGTTLTAVFVEVELTTARGAQVAKQKVQASEGGQTEVTTGQNMPFAVVFENTDPPPAFERLYIRLSAEAAPDITITKPAYVYLVDEQGGVSELPPEE